MSTEDQAPTPKENFVPWKMIGGLAIVAILLFSWDFTRSSHSVSIDNTTFSINEVTAILAILSPQFLPPQ